VTSSRPIVPAAADDDDDLCLWRISGMMIGRSKLIYPKKNLFQYHFVHCKSHMDYPGIVPEPLWREADN
jgi:hypothetical protein